MLKSIIPFLIISLSFVMCNGVVKTDEDGGPNGAEIICTDNSCYGTYEGPEFVNGSDVAHQFSNKMSKKVGEQLKVLYQEEKYSKVNLSGILMSTEGMGTGTVIFKLEIPFQLVEEKCDAYTSFDHSGGWNHKPELINRKRQLERVLLNGELLAISDLKTTPEGLQEYWIQWKNKDVQFDCVRNKEE